MNDNLDNDFVEIRAKILIPSLLEYKEWTKVTRFLAYGLAGIEIREIENENQKILEA